MYAAGRFTNTDGQFFVAKWDGNTWSELGKGSNALKANGVITALVCDKSGNIYAAGSFTNDTESHYIAKWDGSSWSELGPGYNFHHSLTGSGFTTLAIDKSDRLYAAGYFATGTTSPEAYYYLVTWNGTSWESLGSDAHALQVNGKILNIAVDDIGNVYAAGLFDSSTENTGNPYVAHWNGSSWSALGDKNSIPMDAHIALLTCDPSGQVYAAGGFINAGGEEYIAHWDGTGWKKLNIDEGSKVPDAEMHITALNVDAAGALYAGLFFQGSENFYSVTQWNGTGWTILGTGQHAPFGNNSIKCIAFDLSGNVYAASGQQIIRKFERLPVTTAATRSADTKTVALYPNPSARRVQIGERIEDVQWTIQHLTGETVHTGVLKKDESFIDLDDIAPGLYTVLFAGQHGLYAPVKLVVE